MLKLELSGPVFAFLEITNICDNRCPGCGNVFTHGEKNYLTIKEWDYVLEQLVPYIKSVRVTGGEPTLRPDFFELAELLSKKNIRFSIFTNARWKNPDKFLRTLKKFKNFNGFLISLHGDKNTIHDKWTRVEGSFDETLENIELAINYGFNISTNTVISEYNYNNIDEIVALAYSKGVRRFVFNRYYGMSKDKSLLSGISTDNKELIEAIKAIDELKQMGLNATFGNCIPQCFYPSSASGCMTGILYCTVDPFGNIRPCNHAPLEAGNLLKTDFNKIWGGKIMKKWRGYYPSICKGCSKFYDCRSGCKALALTLSAKHDPLIKGPIKEDEPLPETKIEQIKLYDWQIPTPFYYRRKESFGEALILEEMVIPVSQKAVPLLNIIDGEHTLGEINKKFGNEAIKFIYNLQQRGFVNFRPNNEVMDLIEKNTHPLGMPSNFYKISLN